MRLRGIEFGYVLNASGARNLTGKGYWFHKLMKPLGLDFQGSTFVAKTTTLHPRKGNMPLGADGETSLESLPKCIVVKPMKGVALNAVGLSGPGAKFLLESGRWQKRTEPFFLSFMSTDSTPTDRSQELQEFVRLLRRYLPTFRTPIGLQINFSCPNVGINPAELVTEIGQALEIAQELNIPLVPKLNATVPIEPVVEISRHPNFDALVMSNTIPWGKLPERIDWEELFGSTVSPLAHLGGGGLSGKPLLPIVCDWISSARKGGFEKPIVACGGILSADDAEEALWSGASAVELGSISFLRPWRVRDVIRWVNFICSEEGVRAALFRYLVAQS